MPKQYLMLVEEDVMPRIDAVFKGVQFLEIQGMDIGANNAVKLLVTPVLPPVNPIDPSILVAPQAAAQEPPLELEHVA